MKYILANLSITLVLGLVLFSIIVLTISIPFLHCLACILMFYVFLNFGLDGIEEEYKAERQAKIDNKEQVNKN